MNRRQLLTLQISGEQDTAEMEAPAILSGLTPYTGSWTKAEVKHLLRRTMFGATKADVDYFASITMSQAVTELLTPTAVPADPLYTSSSSYDDPNVPFGSTWVNAPYDNLANGFRFKSYRSWWFSQMLNSGRNIQEKMVYFWHNHFATETAVVKDARYSYKYNVLLRQNALGNFKAFTKAITLDPSMLLYLNGYLNTNTKPDENYGRELQELFTIGKDASGNPYYTEGDVQAAAHVLTGYRINPNITSYFDSNKHDTTNKVFSAFYNNTTIVGQSGAAGANELDDLLNMIFATNQAAIFLCRKLYRFFIYYAIDAQTDTDVIQPLADILRNNNYDIVPVLQALFTSEHFYDSLNRGSLIKTPIDNVVGLCRDFSVKFPVPSGNTDQLQSDLYSLWYRLYSSSALMNQVLGDPPNVAGWPAYYQEPQFHELWINATTLPQRNIFSDAMAYKGYSAGTSTMLIDIVGYTDVLTQPLSNPLDPNLLIQEVIDRHLSQDVSQTTKDFLKGYLLSGQTNDSYWSTAWNDYLQNKTNISYYNIVYSRLRSMYTYLMDMAEYQLA